MVEESESLSLYNSSFLYENVPLPRRLGVWSFVSLTESPVPSGSRFKESNSFGELCKEINSFGERSAIASQSVNGNSLLC